MLMLGRPDTLSVDCLKKLDHHLQMLLEYEHSGHFEDWIAQQLRVDAESTHAPPPTMDRALSITLNHGFVQGVRLRRGWPTVDVCIRVADRTYLSGVDPLGPALSYTKISMRTCVATVDVAQLLAIAEMVVVIHIALAQPLHESSPACEPPSFEADASTAEIAAMGATGAGVLVGIIDNGFDLLHPVLHIPPVDSDASPTTRVAGLFGVCPTKSHCRHNPDPISTEPVWHRKDEIDSWIAEWWQSARALGDNTVTLAPGNGLICPEAVHGLAVASIAVGNHNITSGSGVEETSEAHNSYRGVAPEAEPVLVVLPSQSDATLYQPFSTDLLIALGRLFEFAAAENKPCVVNISHNLFAVDRASTSILTDTLDELMEGSVDGGEPNPGRFVVYSAGNFADRRQFLRGISNAHTVSLAFKVPLVRNYHQQRSVIVDVWHDGCVPINGSLCLVGGAENFDIGAVEDLSRYFTIISGEVGCTTRSPPIPHGDEQSGVQEWFKQFVVQVHGNVSPPTSIDLNFSLTIWREVTEDDVVGRHEPFTYQAFLTLQVRPQNNVACPTWIDPSPTKSGTVSPPATGHRGVAVGNGVCVDETFVVGVNSGRGPLGNGRIRPELATFGDGADAAYVCRIDPEPQNIDTFWNRRDGLYTKFGGTSAAAPRVAGTVALLMSLCYKNFAAKLTDESWIRHMLLLSTAALKPTEELGWGRPDQLQQVVTMIEKGEVPLPELIFKRSNPSDPESNAGASGIRVSSAHGTEECQNVVDCGVVNWVYLTVKNVGLVPVRNGYAALHWVDGSDQLARVSTWNTRGIFTESAAVNALAIPYVGPGDVIELPPFLWVPVPQQESCTLVACLHVDVEDTEREQEPSFAGHAANKVASLAVKIVRGG